MQRVGVQPSGRRLGETTGRLQQAEDAWENIGAGGEDTGASRYQEQRGRENWHQEWGRRERPQGKMTGGMKGCKNCAVRGNRG